MGPTRVPATRALLASSLVVVLVRSAAAGTEGADADGARLFAERCAACHAVTPRGTEDLLAVEATRGPDLSFAGSRFKPRWLEGWLVKPTRIRPAGYLPFRYAVPTASGDAVDQRTLPAHPVLGADTARAVAAYLGTLKREMPPYPRAPDGAGEIRAEIHFTKLLPCGGCHRTHGHGGPSGPDLTDAADRLDPEWLEAFIADPLAWRPGTMPKADLRAEQIAALSAYLREAAPPARPDAIPGAGPSGAIASPASDSSRERRGFAPGNDLPVPLPADGRRAARLYRVLCTQCHGVAGNGRGINARYLFVAPRNHRSAAEMGLLSRDGVRTAIRFGGVAVGKSASMPAWGGVLSPEDVDALTDYVWGLAANNATNAASLAGERPAPAIRQAP